MGVKDGYEPMSIPGGGRPYSAKSSFLVPSEENTLTWGDTVSATVDPAAIGEGVEFQLQQLVHVHRNRPTSYNVAVTLLLGPNWSGETNVTFRVRYFIGVGQAKTTLIRDFVLAAPLSNTQPVNDVYQVPATAMQVQAGLIFNAVPVNVGGHPFTVVALAAPVFA
jgi:hypothetical protein